MKNISIIKKPLITEKSLKDAARGIFTFIVDKKANKIEITKEVESQFKVHVLAVTTEIIKGKRKQVGRKKNIVRLPDVKKARVRLKSGEKIDLFEVGGK